MRLAMIALCVVLSGCAWKSQVQTMGPDTYQTSANVAPVRGGITGARKMALSDANKHCAKLGRRIEVLDIESEYAFPANGVATVTFACR